MLESFLCIVTFLEFALEFGHLYARYFKGHSEIIKINPLSEECKMPGTTVIKPMLTKLI